MGSGVIAARPRCPEPLGDGHTGPRLGHRRLRGVLSVRGRSVGLGQGWERCEGARRDSPSPAWAAPGGLRERCPP